MNNAILKDTATTAKFAFKEYLRPLVFAGNLFNRVVFGDRNIVPGTSGPSNASLGITHAMIAARAYEKWCARGCPYGGHQSDWNEAEAEIRAERLAKTNTRPVESDNQKPPEPKQKDREEKLCH